MLVALIVWPAGAQAATCADYDNQADAQRAKDTRDADGDGIYCESLPCPCSTSSGSSSSGSSGGSSGSEPTPKPKPRKRARRYRATVTRAVDGDTIVARYAGRTATVRLLGIDTPEKFAARSGSKECGGDESSAYTAQLVERYPSVYLRTDPTQDVRDRYGRLLVYVDVRSSAGGSYQGRLLEAGWAKAYPYGPRRFQRYAQFRRAQARARAADRGVYDLCGGNFRRPL